MKKKPHLEYIEEVLNESWIEDSSTDYLKKYLQNKGIREKTKQNIENELRKRQGSTVNTNIKQNTDKETKQDNNVENIPKEKFKEIVENTLKKYKRKYSNFRGGEQDHKYSFQKRHTLWIQFDLNDYTINKHTGTWFDDVKQMLTYKISFHNDEPPSINLSQHDYTGMKIYNSYDIKQISDIEKYVEQSLQEFKPNIDNKKG